jgi:predicted transcriptional regulator
MNGKGVASLMKDEPELRRLLWFLLGGSRGGPNRARIIQRLRERPSNQNQLAGDLGLQYKAIQHHVKVLVRSSLIIGAGEKYGVTYSLSPWLESRVDIFEEVCRRLSFDLGAKTTG